MRLRIDRTCRVDAFLVMVSGTQRLALNMPLTVEAAREADRAEAQLLLLRMEGLGGPAQPSPTIAQCLNGDTQMEARGLERFTGRQLELATSLSSGVVRITGMAFGWIGATTAFGSRSRQQ